MTTNEAKRIILDFIDEHTKNVDKKEFVKIAVAFSIIYLKAERYDELRQDLKDLIDIEEQSGMDEIEEKTKEHFKDE